MRASLLIIRFTLYDCKVAVEPKLIFKSIAVPHEVTPVRRELECNFSVFEET